MNLGPGAFHLRHLLTVEEQLALRDRCRALLDGPVPGYVPTVRGGGTMHVRMLCLGRHWNGKTLRYESTRSGFRRRCPCRRCPTTSRALAREHRRVGRHVAGPGHLHHQLLRRRRPDGAAPGQGRERASRSPPACRSSRCRSATPRGFCSAGRAAATRSRRCCWSRATRSCSAAPRGCAITACRASSQARSAGTRDAGTLQPDVPPVGCLRRQPAGREHWSTC